jgi:hypothetical protein
MCPSPDNADEPLEQNMSSTTQSHKVSDIESSGQEYNSSAEEEAAGPQQQVGSSAQPARTVHVPTSFALSLVRRLEEIKAAKPQEVCAFGTHNTRIALNIVLTLEPNHRG